LIELFTLGLAGAVASIYLLYGSAILARRYGFCERCQAYVRRDETACSMCGEDPSRPRSRD
jgi:predicted amidophosphoribosyltransferase